MECTGSGTPMVLTQGLRTKDSGNLVRTQLLSIAEPEVCYTSYQQQ